MNFGVISKRILPVFAAVTALLVGGVAVAQEPNIQVTGATGQAGGSAVTINLSFNDTTAPSTSAFDFVLQFDANLLGTLDVTNCGGPVGAFCNPSGNQVNVIRGSGTPPTAIGDGSIGSIELSIAGDAPIGTFPIQIQSENYFDLNGDNITPSPSGSAAGSIIVEGPSLTFNPAGDNTNTLDTGSAPVGTPTTMDTVTVTESGTDDVVLQSCGFSAAVLGDFPGDFSVTYTGPNAGGGNGLPATFTGGSDASGTLTPECIPSGAGTRSATMTCSVEDGVGGSLGNRAWPLTCAGLAPNVQLPANITVNGTVADADPTGTLTVTNPDDGFTSTATNVAATEGAGDARVTLTTSGGPFGISPDGSLDFDVSCDSSAADPSFTRTIEFSWDNPDSAGPNSGSVDVQCVISDTAPDYNSDPAPGVGILSMTADFGQTSGGQGIDVNNGNPNTEAADLTISATADNAVFDVSFFAGPYAPGAAAVTDAIEVTCTPEGVGTVTGTLTVETDDPNEPMGGFKYDLECVGTGDLLTTSPANGTLGLPAVPPQNQTSGEFGVTNNSLDDTLNISCTIDDPEGIFTFDPVALTLAVGASDQIDVTADPPAVGNFSATLNCTERDGLVEPFTLTANATGRPLIIPTLSQWGLLALMLSLLLAGGLYTRRMLA